VKLFGWFGPEITYTPAGRADPVVMIVGGEPVRMSDYAAYIEGCRARDWNELYHPDGYTERGGRLVWAQEYRP
jgi:hypothetical protein